MFLLGLKYIQFIKSKWNTLHAVACCVVTLRFYLMSIDIGAGGIWCNFHTFIKKELKNLGLFAKHTWLPC